MAIFNDTPAIPLGAALRRYRLRYALSLIEPFAALLLASAVDLPGIRAATAIPTFLLALWPAAFRDAPVSYWWLACVSWFVANLTALAFFGDA